MKAKLGMVVIARGPGASSNGSNEAPGVVTRVWNNSEHVENGYVCVNISVFPDASDRLLSLTSVYMAADEDDANARFAGYQNVCWPAA